MVLLELPLHKLWKPWSVPSQTFPSVLGVWLVVGSVLMILSLYV